MGRWINTALGQRWTDEPLPDHVHFSPAHKQGWAEGYRVGMEKMGGGGSNAPSAPAAAAFPTDSDIEEVGKLLVEGRMWLPKYARVTVTTEIEERTDPIFGTSEIYHHTADELCCHALQPMSIQAAIECKLLTNVGGKWLFRADVYRSLVPADPRLIP